MKNSWLEARYTFSFGEYRNPEWMGFGALRVINDDRIAAGVGFPTHGHRDMEIITIVLDGALAHKDDLGNGATIFPGDVQKMSAGTGVAHSEFNPSQEKATHSLQIWIVPEREGLAASYEQKSFPAVVDEFQLIASRDGRKGSIIVHQDVSLYQARMGQANPMKFRLDQGRRAWIHVAEGSIFLNEVEMAAGDGAAVTEESDLHFAAEKPAHVLLFDLK